MKTYNFKYGHGSVSLSLNEADILAELHGTETPPISDIRSALFASLEQPIDSAPLRQRVRPGDRVALVISHTGQHRCAGGQRYVALLDAAGSGDPPSR